MNLPPWLSKNAEDFIERVMGMRQALKLQGGNLEEIWVDRVAFDQLSSYLMQQAYDGEPESNVWSNGLITLFGKVIIRRKA